MKKENDLENLIETLLRQEKLLFNVISQIPQNKVQEAVFEEGLVHLKKVGSLLDVLIPERKNAKHSAKR